MIIKVSIICLLPNIFVVPTVVRLSCSGFVISSKDQPQGQGQGKVKARSRQNQGKSVKQVKVKKSRPKRSRSSILSVASAPPFLCVSFLWLPRLRCSSVRLPLVPPFSFHASSVSGFFVGVIFRCYEGFSNLPQLGAAATPANYQCVTNPLFTRNDETKQISQAKLKHQFYASLGGIEQKHRREGKYLPIAIYFFIVIMIFI